MQLYISIQVLLHDYGISTSARDYKNANMYTSQNAFRDLLNHLVLGGFSNLNRWDAGASVAKVARWS